MLGRKSLSSAGPVCSPVILLPHNVSLGYSLPSRPRGFSVLSCLKLNCQHIFYFWRNLASLLAVSLACKEVKWKSRGLKLKDLCPGVNLANHCLRYHLIGPHLLTSFWVPDPFYNLKRTLTPTFTLKSAFTPKHIKLCILCSVVGGEVHGPHGNLKDPWLSSSTRLISHELEYPSGRFWSQSAGVWIIPLLLAALLSLGEFIISSKPQFPHLWSQDKNSTYLTG